MIFFFAGAPPQKNPYWFCDAYLAILLNSNSFQFIFLGTHFHQIELFTSSNRKPNPHWIKVQGVYICPYNCRVQSGLQTRYGPEGSMWSGPISVSLGSSGLCPPLPATFVFTLGPPHWDNNLYRSFRTQVLNTPTRGRACSLRNTHKKQGGFFPQVPSQYCLLYYWSKLGNMPISEPIKVYDQ